LVFSLEQSAPHNFRFNNHPSHGVVTHISGLAGNPSKGAGATRVPVSKYGLAQLGMDFSVLVKHSTLAQRPCKKPK